MSRLNRSPRKFNTRFRVVTVVKPEITSRKQMSGTVFDYTEMRAIDTRGTANVVDLLSKPSILSTLKIYNALNAQ